MPGGWVNMYVLELGTKMQYQSMVTYLNSSNEKTNPKKKVFTY